MDDKSKIKILLVLFAAAALTFMFIDAPLNKPAQGKEEPPHTSNVREPVFSGRFYPKDRRALEDMIDSYLRRVEVFEAAPVRGLISPHAGYIYSGPTAAAGYKQLVGRDFDKVIVLAPSHQHGFKGASILNVSHYETPLGFIPVSQKTSVLLESDLFEVVPKAHKREHSLEVQLPFLQSVLPDFELIPVVTGDVDPEKLGEAILPLIDDKTLVVASTDLSHYHAYDQAVAFDSECIEKIIAGEPQGVAASKLCGKIPVLTLMYIAGKKGWTARELDYRNSGDTQGSKDRVVGYASIVYHTGLGREEKEVLLDLARETLKKHYEGEGRPKVKEEGLPPKLKVERGCFVTLNKHNNLRGCIGHITPQTKLYDCVIENALNAALHDRRFKPVTQKELGELEVEVSVLTAPEQLRYDDAQDLYSKIVPKRDGLVLSRGWNKATYLPQVWEQIPDKKSFLTRLCRKAGLKGDCIKDNPDIEVYRAQVFREDG
ncbi:MAG: AmmeMemoRadiSam system protein B [Candidatus Altiarchaeales archaeon]|nr:AmmeMemoRadiSam system protein B [Candidatus Altiarchaeales archaeon]